jgi:ABC-type branched-subunit amino acid transport system ATPase component
MTDTLLEVRDLRKAFGGVVANDAINLDVPRGGIVGLIGPNGSGKTTLFNSIVGQHAIDTGSVRFDGRQIDRMNVPQIARLGLLRTFQQAHVYDGMSCLANMQVSVSHTDEPVAAQFRRFPPEVAVRARELLEFVGLQDKCDSVAGNLSFGQRKLLEFAMALMSEPKMLLLDEPTAGVNPTLINSVVGHLKRANAALGVTLLIIEHNMRVIMNLAEHIYCLAHGRLLASGSPEAVRADPKVIDAYLGAA